MHYVLLYNVYHSIPHGCIIPILSFFFSSFGALLVSQNISDIEGNHNIILRFLSHLLSICAVIQRNTKRRHSVSLWYYINCLMRKKISKQSKIFVTCVIPYFLICVNVLSAYCYEFLSLGIVNSMVKKSVDKDTILFFNAIKEESVQDIVVSFFNAVSVILLVICNCIYHIFFFF